MPKPTKISITDETGGVESAPYLLDWRTEKVALGFDIELDATTAASSFKVQHMFNDWTEETDPSTWTWFDHPDMTGMQEKTDGNYAFPVTGVRLVSDGSGADTGTLFIAQGK